MQLQHLLVGVEPRPRCSLRKDAAWSYWGSVVKGAAPESPLCSWTQARPWGHRQRAAGGDGAISEDEGLPPWRQGWCAPEQSGVLWLNEDKDKIFYEFNLMPVSVVTGDIQGPCSSQNNAVVFGLLGTTPGGDKRPPERRAFGLAQSLLTRLFIVTRDQAVGIKWICVNAPGGPGLKVGRREAGRQAPLNRAQ